MRGGVEGGRSSQTHHARLCGGVDHVVVHRHHRSGDRGDVDDPPVAALLHPRQRGSGCGESGRQVAVDPLGPFGVADAGSGAVLHLQAHRHHSGVVDQNRDVSQLPARLVQEVGGGARFHQVDHRRPGRRTFGAQFGGAVVDAFGRRADGHRVACCRQVPGAGEADPVSTPGAGDHCNVRTLCRHRAPYRVPQS